MPYFQPNNRNARASGISIRSSHSDGICGNWLLARDSPLNACKVSEEGGTNNFLILFHEPIQVEGIYLTIYSLLSLSSSTIRRIPIRYERLGSTHPELIQIACIIIYMGFFAMSSMSMGV
jgi:hypothetical protein